MYYMCIHLRTRQHGHVLHVYSPKDLKAPPCIVCIHPTTQHRHILRKHSIKDETSWHLLHASSPRDMWHGHIYITSSPHWLAFMWWECCGLCLQHKPTELAHSFLFCSCVCSCLGGPFNCISFHEFSPQLSASSLCSSGLVSASLVLSGMCLCAKLSLSPDVILRS